MGSVIQLGPREVLILIGAFTGIVFTFGKLLLAQFERRMSDRFKAMDAQRKSDKEAHAERLAKIEQRQQDTDSHVGDVQRSVEHLRTELPLQYVRREDWIRFGASIDAKLDRLADAVHQRNMRGH